MGGVDKGRLLVNGEPIVVRTHRLLTEAGVECVIVGGEPRAFEDLGCRVLRDDPSTEGPLAALVALLEDGLRDRASAVIAIGCDMPYLERALLARLQDEAPESHVLAPRPRRDGRRWQPLFARYAPAATLRVARAMIEEGPRKLQILLDRAQATELPLNDVEELQLRDWDTIEDVEEPQDLDNIAEGAPLGVVGAEPQDLPASAFGGKRRGT